MLPFCGYNMGDYFQHWLDLGATGDTDKLPRIFFVNWFRKGMDGRYLWPGYGENSRVLKWIFERLEGRADAIDTPIGRTPAPGALDVSGLDLPAHDLDVLTRVDLSVWKEEAALTPAAYDRFGAHLPQALWDQHAALVTRLQAAHEGSAAA